MARRQAPSPYLTTPELMQVLKIRHKVTIYNLIEQGMPTLRLGKDYRFHWPEVYDFLRQATGKKLRRRQADN